MPSINRNTGSCSPPSLLSLPEDDCDVHDRGGNFLSETVAVSWCGEKNEPHWKQAAGKGDELKGDDAFDLKII
jgi:hypothetical protein